MSNSLNLKWLVAVIFCWIGINQNALGFGCNFSSTSVSINLSDVAKIGDEALLYDLSTKTCNGAGTSEYLDAMRIEGMTEESVLQGSGLSIFYVYNGVYYTPAQALYKCVWPYYGGQQCPYVTYSSGTYRMLGKFVLKRTATTAPNFTIAAGKRLSTITLRQRGNYGGGPSWGNPGNRSYIYLTNNDALTFPTCDIDSGSQNQVINLSPVAVGQFSGVGSTVEGSYFFITLDCMAGVSAYATVIDSNQLGNTGPNLSLDRTSTAQGVGIQLLYNGTPIGFGASNQFYAIGNEASPKAKYTIPFEANYVQTASNISAGSVSAKTVISFEYL